MVTSSRGSVLTAIRSGNDRVLGRPRPATALARGLAIPNLFPSVLRPLGVMGITANLEPA